MMILETVFLMVFMNFKSDQIFIFDLARDGNQLAVSRGTVSRDVVLITDVG